LVKNTIVFLVIIVFISTALQSYQITQIIFIKLLWLLIIIKIGEIIIIWEMVFFNFVLFFKLIWIYLFRLNSWHSIQVFSLNLILFSWSNNLFSYFILNKVHLIIIIIWFLFFFIINSLKIHFWILFNLNSLITLIF
jgi:hypothetical protein